MRNLLSTVLFCLLALNASFAGTIRILWLGNSLEACEAGRVTQCGWDFSLYSNIN